MIVKIACRGITPLLFNSMTPSALLALPGGCEVKESKTKGIGNTMTPREVAAPKVYMCNGKPIIPGRMLLSCLIAAGQGVRLDGKRQISTAEKTVLPALMTLLSGDSPLYTRPEGVTPSWEPDIQQGRNPSTSKACCIIRPRFDNWAFDFEIDIHEDEIGENTIRQLVDKAGRRIGLGDFRPMHKGTFGQFVVDSWEKQNETAAAAAE